MLIRFALQIVDLSNTYIFVVENEYNLIEAGCGVGNAAFPIAKLELPNLKIYGFDLSETAI